MGRVRDRFVGLILPEMLYENQPICLGYRKCQKSCREHTSEDELIVLKRDCEGVYPLAVADREEGERKQVIGVSHRTGRPAFEHSKSGNGARVTQSPRGTVARLSTASLFSTSISN